MSSYLYFFIRNKNDFLPIGSFCRSSEIYQLGQDIGAPYAKVKPFTFQDAIEVFNICNEKIQNFKSAIETFREHINFIKECNASLEEKLESLGDYFKTIEGYEEGIEEISEAKNFYSALSIIIDNVKYNDDYDESRYVYFGTDIGCKIEEDEILE